MTDRRDKLTDGVNQRLNHNQERRVGPGDHIVVANLEAFPEPTVSPTPPHRQVFFSFPFWPRQLLFLLQVTAPSFSYKGPPHPGLNTQLLK